MLVCDAVRRRRHRRREHMTLVEHLLSTASGNLEPQKMVAGVSVASIKASGMLR